MPPNRVGVVAALITPLLVLGMRGGPVEFHANPVRLVQVVEVPVAGVLPDSGLPPCCGKPVRAFHPADVAVLEHGQGPVLGVTERQGDFPAPAHLLSGVHSLADPVRSGAPAADCPANPRVCVIEGRGDLDEIEHRILHPGARREHDGMPGPQDRIGSMDNDAGDLYPCWASRRRDRDRDDRTRPVEKTVPLSRRLVAEDRTWTSTKQGSPQHFLPGWVSREGGIYTRAAAAASGRFAPGSASSAESTPDPGLTSRDSFSLWASLAPLPEVCRSACLEAA